MKTNLANILIILLGLIYILGTVDYVKRNWKLIKNIFKN